MSNRALKRLEVSEQNKKAHISDGEDFDDQPIVQKKSIFGTVSIDDIAEDEKFDSFDSDKELSKVTPTTSSKKTKKKKKSKKKKEMGNLTDEFDEFMSVTTNPRDTDQKEVASNDRILNPDVKFMDYLQEIDRIFGRQREFNKHKKSRSGLLVPQRKSFVPIFKSEIDMPAPDADKNFHFEHSIEYKKRQKTFYYAMETNDLDAISHLLSTSPYHIDSLLVLSDVLFEQDNSKAASALLERVLYAYQSALHPNFNFASRNCKLSYKMQQNRGLYIALCKYAMFLSTKGCYRAALEYCKIILNLDVTNDPLAIVLLMDFCSIGSEEFDFLIDFFEQFEKSKCLILLPNFAFTVPLAYRMRIMKFKHYRKSKSKEFIDSELTKADNMLEDALFMFPGFLARIMNKVTIGGVNNLEKSNLFGKLPKISEPTCLGRLLDLYVHRAYHCWQEKETISWLEKIVEQTLIKAECGNRTDLLSITGCENEFISAKESWKPDDRVKLYSEKRKSVFREMPQNVNRHLVISDIKEVPPLVTEVENRKMYAFDPFPPVDSIDIYDPEEERRSRIAAQMSRDGLISTFVQSLWPSYSVDQAARVQGLVDERQQHLDDGRPAPNLANRLQNYVGDLMGNLMVGEELQDLPPPPAYPADEDEEEH